MKGKLILILCILLLRGSIAYAENNITELDLGNPTNLSLSIDKDQFVLSWRNPLYIYSFPNVDYQVDYKVGRGEWASLHGELKPNYLPFSVDGKARIEIDPIREGIVTDKIDLDNFNYSFRVRYRYIGDETIVGFFSSPASLGLLPFYQNASNWAFEELDRSVELKLISDSIRDDMKKEITREEFSEVAVRLYELLTGNTVSINGQSFIDSTNPEVLKAASLGIVRGIGEGKFAPNNPVTRQEIAVMLKRVLTVVNPQMDFSYGALQPTIESNIASWAIEEVSFMRFKEILKGDQDGLINPTGHTTREQAVIMALRTYDTFK